MIPTQGVKKIEYPERKIEIPQQKARFPSLLCEFITINKKHLLQ